MKCPLGISNFLEEISSLSHSVVFLYFFALITEEDFLIYPCYSLELCIQVLISFIFSFALQIAVKRREVKSKGEKERYTHLNAEFQRIARKDKKAYLSHQCKEIEGNNRMGKTRELVKKIRDTKGTFHAKMGSIKDRNCMDLTETEDIKKR